jgi:hypothetical protein
MYETRGYPVDVIVRERRRLERAQRRAQRIEQALSYLRRLMAGRAVALRAPR